MTKHLIMCLISIIVKSPLLTKKTKFWKVKISSIILSIQCYSETFVTSLKSLNDPTEYLGKWDEISFYLPFGKCLIARNIRQSFFEVLDSKVDSLTSKSDFAM